ncbi:unnamed protein product, partial [Scytosiphon promiscuus]
MRSQHVSTIGRPDPAGFFVALFFLRILQLTPFFAPHHFPFLSRFPLNRRAGVVGAVGGAWKPSAGSSTGGVDRGEGMAVTALDAMPALLATCFALYYTHCISQRRSPFPGPFRYELRELPLSRMLRLTAQGAWTGSSSGSCCDEGMASVHSFMLPAVMDVCPELFCPEQRAVNDSAVTAATTTISAITGDAVSGAADGQKEETRHVLDKAFVQRATIALVAAPYAAADVMRALLSCPVPVLLSAGEEALKGMLPKVSGPSFPRRDSVASLCRKVWMRLYGVHPHGQAMETWTLNALLQADSDAPVPRAVTYETMCREPVLVFRCRTEALSCPYLLQILLKILRSLLLASERAIDQAVAAKN